MSLSFPFGISFFQHSCYLLLFNAFTAHPNNHWDGLDKVSWFPLPDFINQLLILTHFLLSLLIDVLVNGACHVFYDLNQPVPDGHNQSRAGLSSDIQRPSIFYLVVFNSCLCSYFSLNEYWSSFCNIFSTAHVVIRACKALLCLFFFYVGTHFQQALDTKMIVHYLFFFHALVSVICFCILIISPKFIGFQLNLSHSCHPSSRFLCKPLCSIRLDLLLLVLYAFRICHESLYAPKILSPSKQYLSHKLQECSRYLLSMTCHVYDLSSYIVFIAGLCVMHVYLSCSITLSSSSICLLVKLKTSIHYILRHCNHCDVDCLQQTFLKLLFVCLLKLTSYLRCCVLNSYSFILLSEILQMENADNSRPETTKYDLLFYYIFQQ